MSTDTKVNPEDMDRMVAQYVATALWSTRDESDPDGDIGDSLDQSYSADDIHPDTLKAMRDDCQAFAEANAEQIEQWDGEGDAWEQAGYDFWLTRNGHGAGFWDRGPQWPNDGEDLTSACKPYGVCDLYVGDDGLIHST